MALSQIKIKYISAILPASDYELIINVNEYREVEEPELNLLRVETDRPHRTINNPFQTRNQLIQSQIYERRSYFIDINENQKIDLMRASDNITVITDEGETYNGIVEQIPQDEQSETWKWFAKVTFIKLADDEAAVSNELTYNVLQGRFTNTELNRLILTVNPDWINAKAKGNVYFADGFDFNSDNKDFIIRVDAVDYPISVSANTTTHLGVVQQINNAIFSQEPLAYAQVRAYDGKSFVGFTSITNDPSTSFQLKAGITDDLLVLLGVNAQTYSNNTAIDSTFENEGNTLTFYTKLMPIYQEDDVDSETQTVSGIELPVYSNQFLSFSIDFYLDNYEIVYGNLTELQAFDLYVPQCWYVDSSGNAKGQELDVQNTTQYDALESVQIERIDNDSLFGVEHRRITFKYVQSQNYRFR